MAALGTVQAAAAAEAEALARAPMAAPQVTQVALGLALVLALIAALAWALKRALRLQPGVDGQLRVLGGLSIGARERVVLVQVGDAQVLVGVAPGSVRALHVLDQPVAVPAGEAPQAQPGFAALVSRFSREEGGGG